MEAIKNESTTAGESTIGMTTKVVKGSMWTFSGQIAPIAVSLIATPFVIRMLGSEAYGVLILVALIPTYFGFADFGMSLASTKFGSEAYAEGDPEKEARVVRTAAVIALLAATPIAALIFAFSYQISALFNVPEYLHAEAALALKFAAITFVVNFLNGIFNTPQLARLRMDLNTFVTSGFRILGIIATPFVIYFGGGIVGAAIVLMTASLSTLAAHIFVSGRLLPNIKGLSIRREMFRPMFKFGIALVIGGIASMILINVEKGMLSALISPTALAYYFIAFTLVNMMTMFSGAMVQSLLPAFSQLQDRPNRSQLNTLFSRGIKMNLIWLVPSLVFVSIVAKPVFTVWAGEDFGRESVIPFYVLLAGIVVNIIAYFPHTAIIASGRTDALAKLYWLEAPPYILLVWLLTTNFGIIGAAAAWSIRVIADAILMFAIAKQVASVSYERKRFGPFMFASAVMIVPFGANLYFQAITPLVIILAVIAASAYFVVIFRHVLELDEINWLRQSVLNRFPHRAE